MEINPKYKLRRLVAMILVGVCLSALFLIVTKSGKEGVFPLKQYDLQTIIAHEMKVSATPIYNPNNHRLTIQLDIESYQHPEKLEESILERAMLETDQAYKPDQWDIKSQTKYTVNGIVGFPNVSTPNTEIVLFIYGVETIEMKWKEK